MEKEEDQDNSNFMAVIHIHGNDEGVRTTFLYLFSHELSPLFISIFFHSFIVVLTNIKDYCVVCLADSLSMQDSFFLDCLDGKKENNEEMIIPFCVLALAQL